MQQLYNNTVTSGQTPCFILVLSDQLAGTLSHLSHLWKSGFLDAKTSLSDFSAVLRAVGVLWPSWTHFTDSAAAHFVGMFTHSWFCLGRNEGGGRVGGWQMRGRTTKRSPKLFMRLYLRHKWLNGLFFHTVIIRGECGLASFVYARLLQKGGGNAWIPHAMFTDEQVWALSARFGSPPRLAKRCRWKTQASKSVTDSLSRKACASIKNIMFCPFVYLSMQHMGCHYLIHPFTAFQYSQ